MIKFVEVVGSEQLLLEELWINEDSVVKIKEGAPIGNLPPQLHEDHSFTSVTLNNCGIRETHVVVGSVESVAAKLNKNKRQLLKG